MSKEYSVIITESARNDILSIWTYIADNDSPEQADEIYDELKVEVDKLRYMPEKGHLPVELERIDVYDYFEVHHKPYRVIYSIESDVVVLYAVIDGRRSLMTALSKRLFR